MINVVNDFTVITLVEEEEKSGGGIILSEAAKSTLPKGKVISSKLAEEGDTVLMMNQGNKAMLNGEEVYIVKNDFIIGVLK